MWSAGGWWLGGLCQSPPHVSTAPSLLAPRQTDVVHMLPALELVEQLKQRPFFAPKWPLTPFRPPHPPPSVVMQTSVSCVCPPNNNERHVHFSPEVFVVGTLCECLTGSLILLHVDQTYPRGLVWDLTLFPSRLQWSPPPT